MGVNLIFKIAAVGILVSIICQVLKHSGREEQALSLIHIFDCSEIQQRQRWWVL